VALAIEEPTPFVEVLTHVSDMNPEHVFVFIGSLRVRMYDRPLRKIQRQPIAVDTPCEVDILGVHKKPLVKQSCLYRCRRAQQHETAT
jgi:hypothetical protein